MNKTLEKIKKLPWRSITTSDVVNVWLEEFFSTSLEELDPLYEKDEEGNFPQPEVMRFYKEHAVTQEQHDWWLEEMNALFKKKSHLKRSFNSSFDYLNTAPSIIKDEL